MAVLKGKKNATEQATRCVHGLFTLRRWRKEPGLLGLFVSATTMGATPAPAPAGCKHDLPVPTLRKWDPEPQHDLPVPALFLVGINGINGTQSHSKSLKVYLRHTLQLQVIEDNQQMQRQGGTGASNVDVVRDADLTCTHARTRSASLRWERAEPGDTYGRAHGRIVFTRAHLVEWRRPVHSTRSYAFVPSPPACPHTEQS